jgi:hypothetical protein
VTTPSSKRAGNANFNSLLGGILDRDRRIQLLTGNDFVDRQV